MSVERRRRSRLAVCNLCSGSFRRKSIYARFCNTCKKENEVYRFGDCWSGLGRPADVGLDDGDSVPLSEAWVGA